ENLLFRQQRAFSQRRQAAAAQVLPDPEMRDNALRLQKLKRLYALRQDLLRDQERALRRHDDAAAVHRHPEHDLTANAPQQRSQELRHETQVITNTNLHGVNANSAGGAKLCRPACNCWVGDSKVESPGGATQTSG